MIFSIITETLQVFLFSFVVNESYRIGKSNNVRVNGITFVTATTHILLGLIGCFFLTWLVLNTIGQGSIEDTGIGGVPLYEQLYIPSKEHLIMVGSKTFIVLFVPYLVGLFSKPLVSQTEQTSASLYMKSSVEEDFERRGIPTNKR